MAGKTLVSPIERFYSKVDRSGTCWLWTATINNRGYGLFYLSGRMVLAHRVAYEIRIGPIPPGAEIDHVRERGCAHRHCVNPAHLEPVTHRENLLRGSGFAATNARKTQCIHGHELTPQNTYVRHTGWRGCRTCKRAGDARRRARLLEIDDPAATT